MAERQTIQAKAQVQEKADKQVEEPATVYNVWMRADGLHDGEQTAKWILFKNGFVRVRKADWVTILVEGWADETEKCLEDHVSNIFKTASHFNAILLVDEADVFLQGRSVGGVHDHSVTVFLRKLEYFEGVLFLTTNRVDEFDNAILSRIHYKLKYEDLGREFRRDVWRSFLSKSHTHQGSAQVSNDELHKLEGLDLSARDIKNLAMIAHALATVGQDRVSYTHLEQAAASNEEFARAFNRTERIETMYN
ncbi:hypothetical protein ACJ73_07293 [Blastomyces percursus]|uniref:ATPase AAA-type core domain-containing protein n=1 Tax=Blastomyces percursus TaxID=1658174 RepID=A0A1J9PYH3_9EURO|nr:hypothetical protein ACJ73_07293 [Blastomyces percursus]